MALQTVHMRLSYALVVAGLVWLNASSARGEPKSDMTVMVEMDDGQRLATDVYLPKSGGSNWPVRLVRTPYGRRAYAQEYGKVAERGYAVIVQDMRGRFDSEGKDLAFLDCGWTANQDGLRTLEWIHAQPWCNGRIGTEGASAMGITQCMMAPTAGHLVAAQYIAVAAPSLYHHASYVGGAWRASLTVGWLSDGNFDPDNLWQMTLHPFYDSYWQGLDSIRKAPEIDIPAVHFGGWYDVFLQGTIDGFVSRTQLRRAAGPRQTEAHHRAVGARRTEGSAAGRGDVSGEQPQVADPVRTERVVRPLSQGH
jgi:predicted acyl esterase